MTEAIFFAMMFLVACLALNLYMGLPEEPQKPAEPDALPVKKPRKVAKKAAKKSTKKSKKKPRDERS